MPLYNVESYKFGSKVVNASTEFKARNKASYLFAKENNVSYYEAVATIIDIKQHRPRNLHVPKDAYRNQYTMIIKDN